MARRGIHNDAATLLKDCLDGKIALDFDTARRLFTLICVLHIKALVLRYLKITAGVALVRQSLRSPPGPGPCAGIRPKRPMPSRASTSPPSRADRLRYETEGAGVQFAYITPATGLAKRDAQFADNWQVPPPRASATARSMSIRCAARRSIRPAPS